MEAPKNDKRRSIPSTLGCFGLLFFLCFGCFGVLVLLTPYFGAIQRTELDSAIIPTAESLLDVPHEIDFEWGSLYVGAIEDETWTSNIVCVIAELFQENYSEFQNNSTLYINGAWVIGARDLINTDGPLTDSYIIKICAFGELQPGIHLIEFHLKDSFFGEPIHIQQWAIEIE